VKAVAAESVPAPFVAVTSLPEPGSVGPADVHE
jgi:hypothetical protein